MFPSRAELHIDVLILGGGIAGLWTLARLRSEGYSGLLVESQALGAGQTIASQGIIHGGVKYALAGSATSASKAIAEMPGVWRACLQGRGEIDLRAVNVLNQRQYLWTTTGIGSRIAGVAASKVIRTSVESILAAQRPDWLSRAPKSVDVYAVDEPILDPRSLVAALAEPLSSHLIAGTPEVAGSALSVRAASGESIGIIPQRIILAAGQGNAELMNALGLAPVADTKPSISIQRRPLHMVMARGDLPAIFGHCVGFSDKPRITITSQPDDSGRMVWYIGGDIAETGVARPSADQIAAARAEVAACLPWVDLARTQWACLRIDRAEGVLDAVAGTKAQRPDEPFVYAAGRAIVAFPTKLAFAPLLASRILELVRAAIPSPAPEAPTIPDFPHPAVAPLPWNNPGITWT